MIYLGNFFAYYSIVASNSIMLLILSTTGVALSFMRPMMEDFELLHVDDGFGLISSTLDCL